MGLIPYISSYCFRHLYLRRGPEFLMNVPQRSGTPILMIFCRHVNRDKMKEETHFLLHENGRLRNENSVCDGLGLPAPCGHPVTAVGLSSPSSFATQ